VLAAALALGTTEAAGPSVIHVMPVPLRPQAAEPPGTVARVGELIYRGGVALSSPDARFGGWSDMRVSADGTTLTAISDRGAWLQARILHDAGGTLKGLAAARIGRLVDPAGRPFEGFKGDAESLAATADGGWIVGFERRHRMLLYPRAEPPFSAPPALVPPPPGLERAPSNGGLEALVQLGPGQLLALTEDLTDAAGDIVGWIREGTAWRQIGYAAEPRFRPTAATILPDGDLVVLERRLGFFDLAAARLARVPRDQLAGASRLVGRTMALIEEPMTVDNFEGIDAVRGPRGETLIYILSDDNFSFLQRTLLLCFEVARD